ncbi:MAG: hypothetical protein KA109_19130 [Saprospiraceae bacterium]|jgi:hypothetical protein|nr:hypothetical protein [Saprospiraceae bacterium]MBK6815983.1 hypothetical protein [Saprospiraceae bacterium]MBK7370562.1 hypothetical protein [Saprospiraceae bacterium]MBK8511669.1 hypothetical protein [Saprospiraceae bacterium]MBK8777338.1 hypothetical protein [Saprospiraceae bacterium]
MIFSFERTLFSTLLIILVIGTVAGQADSITIQSATIVNKAIRSADPDSTSKPKKPGLAFWYGLAIPGAGQIYNKRWWKLPLVYGAYGAALYNIKYSRDNYAEWNGYYTEALRTNMPVLVRPDISFNAKQIKVYRDRFRDKKDVAIFMTIGVHLLASLEAFVDSHLKSFSMDEDLSFKTFPETRSFGLAYNLH